MILPARRQSLLLLPRLSHQSNRSALVPVKSAPQSLFIPVTISKQRSFHCMCYVHLKPFTSNAIHFAPSRTKDQNLNNNQQYNLLKQLVHNEDHVGVVELLAHLIRFAELTVEQVDVWLSQVSESIQYRTTIRLLIEYYVNRQNMSTDQVIELMKSLLESDYSVTKGESVSRDDRLLSGEIDYFIARQYIQRMQRGDQLTDEEMSQCLVYIDWAIHKRPSMYQAYNDRAMIAISGRMSDVNFSSEDKRKTSDDKSDYERRRRGIEADIQECLSINSAYPPGYLSQGLYYSNFTDMYEKAIDSFSKCIDLLSKQIASNDTRFAKLEAAAYFHRASIHLLEEYSARDAHKALADYNRAIQLDPNNPLLYQMRGTLYVSELNDRDKALKDFEKAQSLIKGR